MSDSTSTTGFIPPDPAHLAELFPGYQIVRLIACGGMGAVYEALQIALDRAVAIKILPREFTDDDSFRTSFQAEAKAMARLNHPNLIGVHDFGEVEGMLYIIMEYVPGHSLFDAAGGQPILSQEVVPLISAISRGLAHAHATGIIHRDIKPANILLNHENEPKIGDFGLARPLESKIQDGEDIFGTPGYTAPEVIDNPQSIDHRADIYSLGVLLHELLTGQLPGADPRDASAICQCDPRFDAVIRKATHPSPAARYTSAAEVAADIEKISTTAGPRALQTASPPGRAPRVTRTTYPAPKSSDSKGTLIVVLLIAIGIVGFLYFQKSEANKENGDLDTQWVETPPTDEPEAGTDAPRLPITDTEKPPTPTKIDGVEHWFSASSSWHFEEDRHHYSVVSIDIAGKADSGAFKHEPWSGHGVFTLHLGAPESGAPLAKAGLMIRDGLGGDAPNVFLARNRSGEIILQHRSRADSETVEQHRAIDSSPYLRLQRAGSRVTAAISEDGEVWLEIGSLFIDHFTGDILVGFAASSRSNDPADAVTGWFHELEMAALDLSAGVNDAPPTKLNLREFFTRARSIMKGRAAPIMESHRAQLASNNDAFKAEGEGLHTRMAGQGERASMLFGHVVQALEKRGRLPDAQPDGFAEFSGFPTMYEKYYANQRVIDQRYREQLAELAEVYIHGLNLQIERSKAASDPVAVEILEAEVRRTKNVPHHLRDLIELGR